MDPKFQSSFIPNRPTIGSGSASAPVQRHSTSLLSLLGTAIFVLALIFSAGIFAYEKYLNSRLKSMESTLSAARESLQPALIEELVREDSRMSSASAIINSHVSLSALFELIEELTLKSVRFTSFSFRISDTDRNMIQIEMKGEALTYKNVALQEQIFAGNPNIVNPLFYDLDLNDKGDVTFSFKALVDPQAISFVKQLESLNTVPVGTNVPEGPQNASL